MWYADLDEDGFGDENDAGFASCDAPALSANENSDCDDGDDAINPGELERHDGLDKNCDSFDFVCGESMVRVYPTGVADADYTSIQAAVDDFDQILLCDGDIIEVTPGTYFENLSVVDVDPVIRGVVGPGVTIIDGGGAGRTVNLERFSGTLEGFAIIGGNASVEVQKQGGGVRLYYGDGAVLNDLVVDGNSADDGGGVEVRHPTDVTLSNLTVMNNSATGITGNGGGIRVSTTGGQSSGYLLMSGLQVETNDANNKGGGVYVAFEVGSPVAVSLEDSTFTTNDANLAGGLYVTDTATFDLFRTDFIGNVGTNNFGGVQIERSGAWLEDVLLSGNEGSTSAAMQISEYTYGPVTLNRVQAEDNTLTGVSGIGYAVDLKGDFQDGTVLNQVEVTGTSRALLGIFGGGLNVTGTLDAKNLLVYDNSGATGMYIAEESVFPAASQAGVHVIENSSFVGNDGDGLQVGNAIGSIALRNMITAYNGGWGVNDLVRDPVVTYSSAWSNGLGTYANVLVPVGANGNVEEDPMFVAYSAATPSTSWDLHLGLGSTLIDAGDPDPFFNDPDGSTADMGYYGGPGAP